jgi:hypothetical protein
LPFCTVSFFLSFLPSHPSFSFSFSIMSSSASVGRKPISRIPSTPTGNAKGIKPKVASSAAAAAATGEEDKPVKPKMHDVAHKANWASMFEWLNTKLKERAETGGLSFVVHQDTWMRTDLDLHEVLSYLIEHIRECMSQKHDVFPEPLATYISDLPEEMHVTWQVTSLQAWLGGGHSLLAHLPLRGRTSRKLAALCLMDSGRTE